jgi:hypothetical protein
MSNELKKSQKIIEKIQVRLMDEAAERVRLAQEKLDECNKDERRVRYPGPYDVREEDAIVIASGRRDCNGNNAQGHTGRFISELSREGFADHVSARAEREFAKAILQVARDEEEKLHRDLRQNAQSEIVQNRVWAKIDAIIDSYDTPLRQNNFHNWLFSATLGDISQKHTNKGLVWEFKNGVDAGLPSDLLRKYLVFDQRHGKEVLGDYGTEILYRMNSRFGTSEAERNYHTSLASAPKLDANNG